MKLWEEYGDNVHRMEVDGGYLYNSVKGLVFVPSKPIALSPMPLPVALKYGDRVEVREPTGDFSGTVSAVFDDGQVMVNDGCTAWVVWPHQVLSDT